MISSVLKGGLGNYMFQIAAGVSLANDLNVEFKVFRHHIHKVHEPVGSYESNILRNIRIDPKSTSKLRLTHFKEPHFEYKPLPLRDNQLIDGYFQSEKHFTADHSIIRKLFSPTEKELRHIQSRFTDFNATCSIHVRRGNYLSLPDHHPVCEMGYYEKAMSQFSSNTRFILFSNDISWCKNHFKGNYEFVENETDHIEMHMMSRCASHIIANSTFSWWGAWLNPDNDKKVIAPMKWFGRELKLNTLDLLPQEWLKI